MGRKIAVVLLAVVLCLAAFVCVRKFLPTSERVDPEEYFGPAGEDVPTFGVENERAAAVIVDDHITSEAALIAEGEVYLAYSLVEQELNSRFYWDASENVMLFTTPEELFEIGVDTSFYTIDQKGCDAGYEIVRSSSTGLFLSMRFLEQYSDLSCEVFEDPARVVVTMGSEQIETATVKKKSVMRELGGIKSPILTDLEKGQRVTVVEQMENWTQVVTEDGYIGYVRNHRLTDAQETTRETYYQADYSSISLDERVNLVWHEINYPEMNANLTEDMEGVSGVNVVSPTWYYLSDNEGGILSYADASYVEQAHEAGWQVWPLISNFSSEVSTSTVLSTRWVRRSVEHYLVEQALELGFDGINIDFEGIAESSGYDYVQFLRELSILCRVNGIILSVDVPVPYSFNTYYNRLELGTVCDYVIMMGYDEHYAGSDAGSVASLSFEEDGIVNTLEAVPKEKLISGIPFYSRIWYTKTYGDGTTDVSSEVVSMDSARSILTDRGAEAIYDEETGQNYAEWIDEDGVLCQIWMEDEESVTKRAALVRDYDLGGIASWRLGRESKEVWEIIEEALIM